MKGRILGAGAISGDDGQRYYYDESELKNVQEGQRLENAIVDFDIKDGKAVGVYIIKSNFSINASGLGQKISQGGARLQSVNIPGVDNKFIFFNPSEAIGNILKPNIHSIKVFAILGILFGFIAGLVLTMSQIPLLSCFQCFQC